MNYMRTAFFLLLLASGLGIVGSNWSTGKDLGDSSNGIHFSHQNWEGVLAQAKNEGKPIFVDIYATWCGPCRYMNKMVFTKRKLGAFYNENFISVKIDAEKGEGKALARKFGVTAYPTLVFLNSKGNVVINEEGARTSGQLISMGKRAMRLNEK